MMVLDESTHHVVGLITSRDILRIIAAGIAEDESNDQIMGRAVGDHMTPISQVIYGRPEETVGMCRTIMAKLGIKCLPILSREGRVEGLITARDMSDYGLNADQKGGKKSYLNDVSERVGLSSNTSMAEPPTYLKAHLALEQTPLFVNIGQAELPHPFKTPNGQEEKQRNITGPQDYTNDPTLSEDSSFVCHVSFPEPAHPPAVNGFHPGGRASIADPSSAPPAVVLPTLRQYTYLGVADGVGSWREYHVDPRLFSRRLMQECENILIEATARSNGSGNGHHSVPHAFSLDALPPVLHKDVLDHLKFRQVIPPATLMAQAYDRVKAENIVGSSTACIALFDGIRHQLHFSNLGDSGIIVLRHIDSDVAGVLKRERDIPRSERTSDLRLAFVSQQQLKSFNHPFQLGYTGDDLAHETSSFQSARDACTSSVYLRRGDIVILATDGLYDNVDVDEIRNIALEWEQRHGFIRGGDIMARERRWAMGNSLSSISAEYIHELADELCQRARANSVDTKKDSPFALLAKENDIMWSGGMPDDVTVQVLHIVGRDPNDRSDQLKK
jgi:protein phosphatase PTC7